MGQLSRHDGGAGLDGGNALQRSAQLRGQHGLSCLGRSRAARQGVERSVCHLIKPVKCHASTPKSTNQERGT